MQLLSFLALNEKDIRIIILILVFELDVGANNLVKKVTSPFPHAGGANESSFHNLECSS